MACPTRVPSHGAARRCMCVSALLTLFVLVSAPSSAQPSIRITSPADRTVVHPGQTVKVTVHASGMLLGVFIVPGGPLEYGQPAVSGPGEFLIKVPPGAPAGLYSVIAGSGVRPREPIYSDPILLDVEPAAPTVQLSVEPDMLPMVYPGDRHGLRVIAKLGDGSSMEITSSTRTTFSSSAPGVAEVSAGGVVLAKAPGSATIIVNGGFRVLVTVLGK